MKLRNINILLLALLIPLCATAKKKEKNNSPSENHKVYIYGFATTFNSETVYITDIQQLDSAFIMKSGFLFSRDTYSYQLREYMKTLGVENAVSVVSFAKTRDKAEKKYLKLKKRYTNPKIKKNKETLLYDVVFINQNDFKFTSIAADDAILKKDALWKAEQKELKKKAKAEAKENKRKVKEAKAARKAANQAAIREQKQRHRQERKTKQ